METAATIMDRGRANPNIDGREAKTGYPYVWAVISYLDSATDYRECLPRPGRRNRNGRQLAMLDDENNPSCAVPNLALVIPGLMLVILQVLAIFL